MSEKWYKTEIKVERLIKQSNSDNGDRNAVESIVSSEVEIIDKQALVNAIAILLRCLSLKFVNLDLKILKLMATNSKLL